MREQEKKRGSGKWMSMVPVAAPALLIAAGGVFAGSVYRDFFKRESASETRRRTIDEFKGLKVKECTFPSNRGQRLAGYLYSKENLTPKGVVIMAQGLGLGGHCVNMDAADYFTSSGYLVFAYDATGTDKSEGKSVIGMPQGVIDLSYAISCVEQDSEMKKYPIVLYGHSWGAYCVCAVLNVHPEIKAVAAVSGFNKPSEFYKTGLEKLSPFLGPYFNLYEKIKFGKYADYSSLSGFANTKAGVMIIQSRDDRNVPEASGYDLYYAKYRDDSRFRFKLYEDRGHMFIFYTDAARKYDRQYMHEETSLLTEYGQTHPFDKAKGYEADADFFGNIRDFFNEYCR
jgi:dipeptidyl aminopeptidase/acylaminoacyl peptidase